MTVSAVRQSEDLRAEMLRIRRLPRWGRRQGDDWDTHSRFIYTTRSLDALRQETRRVAAQAGLPLRPFACYVIHRWYNFQTHQVALDILCSHPRVRREENPRHPTVDFYLDDEPFDLKMTYLPVGYGRPAAYAQAHPEDLACWLYLHQSREGRHHLGNRLFILFHNEIAPQCTWMLRRDFTLIEQSVACFLESPRLFTVRLGPDQPSPRSGVIFCVQG